MTPFPARNKANLRSPRRRFAILSLAFLLGAAGIFLAGDGAVIKAKAVVAQVLLEQAWAKTLSGKETVKPWGWADVWPVLKVEIPRLRASAIVLSGVSGEAMAFGPGLMEGTPSPGENGLAVIAGHRDTHFRFLKDVRIGDDVVVTNSEGEKMTFRIVETKIVTANKSGLYTEGSTPRIALVTCWPFDAIRHGDQRFVAIAALRETVSP